MTHITPVNRANDPNQHHDVTLEIENNNNALQERTNLVAQPTINRRLLIQEEMQAIFDDLPSTYGITCGIIGMVAVIAALGIKHFSS